MEAWTHVYSHRRKQLVQYQLSDGLIGNDNNSAYLFYSRKLISLWLIWKVLIFLVDLYYINECFLWVAFPSFYSYASNSLLPLNLIFMSLLFLHTIFKLMMTQRLPASCFEHLGPKTKYLLYTEHLCRYDNNLLHLVIYLTFAVSFFIPYNQAQWLHLVYTFRIVEMDSLLTVVYRSIHTSKLWRVVYRLAMLTVIILYLSHLIACIFYSIDQGLIDSQYFGDPVTNPSVYYQFNSNSFMPIEMLSYTERYIMALYFANGLVSLEAYGDIVGQNWIESLYVGVLMVLSTIMTAFLLQEFMIMVEYNRFAIFQVIKDYKHLEQLMAQKGVKQELRLKIRNFIFYIEYSNKFQNPKLVLGKLTRRMQVDLFYKGYGSYIEQIFAEVGFTKIRKLCENMEEATFQPEIDVFMPEWKAKDHLCDRETCLELERLGPDLLYLIEGRVSQYVQWSHSSDKFYLRKGIPHMNVFQFLTKRHVRYGLKTKEITKFIVLKRDHFQRILEEEETFRKELAQIKEKVLSNSISRVLMQDQCEVCEENQGEGESKRGKDHSVLNCPEVHYVVDGGVETARRVEDLLGERWQERRGCRRKEVKSGKVVNVLHYTVIFARLSSVEEEKQEDVPQQHHQERLSLGVSYLQKTIKSLVEKVHLAQHPEHESNLMDSSYDPNAPDQFWRIDHDHS